MTILFSNLKKKNTDVTQIKRFTVFKFAELSFGNYHEISNKTDH